MAAKKKTTEHPHKCECTHAKVKFCGGCQLVHCLDCKTEWSVAPCTKQHVNQWWSSALYPTQTLAGSALGPLQATSNQFQIIKNDGHDLTPSISCAHLNS